jgi:hypothetical protein
MDNVPTSMQYHKCSIMQKCLQCHIQEGCDRVKCLKDPLIATFLLAQVSLPPQKLNDRHVSIVGDTKVKITKERLTVA